MAKPAKRFKVPGDAAPKELGRRPYRCSHGPGKLSGLVGLEEDAYGSPNEPTPARTPPGESLPDVLRDGEIVHGGRLPEFSSRQVSRESQPLLEMSDDDHAEVPFAD